MIRQFELVERVHSYDPDADEEVLNRAYVYGLKKHGTQLRASVAVARLSERIRRPR